MSRERKIEVLKSMGAAPESLSEMSDAKLDAMIMQNLDKVDVLTDEIKELLEDIDGGLENVSSAQMEAYADSMIQQDFPKIQQDIAQIEEDQKPVVPNFL